MKMNALSVLAREWMVSPCQEITISGPVDVQAIDTFADAISSGSLPKLEVLSLNNNKISDAGVVTLARAIASGSLGNLKVLRLWNNQMESQRESKTQKTGVRQPSAFVGVVPIGKRSRIITGLVRLS